MLVVCRDMYQWRTSKISTATVHILQHCASLSQNEYNCGPNKVPPPGELRAVDVVQRIRVSVLLLPLPCVHVFDSRHAFCCFRRLVHALA
jgi:hypothetical protein